MRSSSGGTCITGSDRPVPRLSHATSRVRSAILSRKGVKIAVGSSHTDTLLTHPGIQISVGSRSPHAR